MSPAFLERTMSLASKTPPNRWAMYWSLATGLSMLLIGGVVLQQISRLIMSVSEPAGLVLTFYAMLILVLLVLPAFIYLFLALFMQPGQLWPMAILLPFAVLQVLAGGIGLWQLVWNQDTGVWFAWLLIIYTAVPAIIAVLLIRAMRDTRLVAGPGGRV
jgi:hypothetical protein